MNKYLEKIATISTALRNVIRDAGSGGGGIASRSNIAKNSFRKINPGKAMSNGPTQVSQSVRDMPSRFKSQMFK